MLWAAFAVGLIAVATAAILLTPGKVSYKEEVTIGVPAAALYDHIRLQRRLMQWSAWPSETGSACACEGVDGEVGARMVYFSKAGERFGYQEIVDLEPQRRIVLALKSKGPPQRPTLSFELSPLGPALTHVVLRFDNVIKRPFNVITRLAGIVRWTRAMHVKDLEGLKRYAEPPHRTYTGNIVPELLAG